MPMQFACCPVHQGRGLPNGPGFPGGGEVAVVALGLINIAPGQILWCRAVGPRGSRRRPQRFDDGPIGQMFD